MSLFSQANLERSDAFTLESNKTGDLIGANVRSDQLPEIDIKKTFSIKAVQEDDEDLLQSKIIERVSPIKMVASEKPKQRSIIKIEVQETKHRKGEKPIKLQYCSNPAVSNGWNKQELLYLQNYYKYGCQKLQNRGHKSTFQDRKQMERTMNLTSWMAFCKDMQIMKIFVKIAQGIKFLCTIFKKNESNEKRLNFEGFCSAVEMIMAQSDRDGKGRRQNQRGKRLLGLTSKQEHISKLKKMKVNIIESHQQKNRNKSYLKQKKHGFQQNRDMSEKQNKKTEGSVGKKKKIYLLRQDRIQSRLLSRLNLNSLNKVHVRSEPLPKYSADDSFLNQYLQRKRKITEGIVKRMEERSGKYLRKTTPKKQVKEQKKY